MFLLLLPLIVPRCQKCDQTQVNSILRDLVYRKVSFLSEMFVLDFLKNRIKWSFGLLLYQMTYTSYSINLNTSYRSVECQYAILISYNTPYCLEEPIHLLDYRIQYAVLCRRFDTSYPTGGYGVSGDHSE
ncbi:hypothetical protein Tco_1432695 [Tanacetum coccineum]